MTLLARVTLVWAAIATLLGCDSATAPPTAPDAPAIAASHSTPAPVFCGSAVSTEPDPLSVGLHWDGAADPAGGAYTHLVDLAPDRDNERLYAAGRGGTFVFSTADGGLELLGANPMPLIVQHLTLLDDDRYMVSNRYVGPVVFDASDPSSHVGQGTKPLVGVAGGAFASGVIYLVTHDGNLHVLSAEQPLLSTLETMGGLGHPWSLVVAGDYAWVADEYLGVVAVDLTVPLAPAIVGLVDGVDGVQEVEVGPDDVVYAAAGSGGVFGIDVSDPTDPDVLWHVATMGVATSVSYEAGRLWVAEQLTVTVLDVSEPGPPTVLAVETTEQWAMHVEAEADFAWVADWADLDQLLLDPGSLAPEIHVEPATMHITGDEAAIEIAITNQGPAPLSVLGIGWGDAALTAVAPFVLDPSETAILDVPTTEDSRAEGGSLCVLSDDPDEPETSVVVKRLDDYDGKTSLVGLEAPLFVLDDLGGVSHSLADYRGGPVLLVFFSSW